MKLDNICICKTKPSTTEKVVECHGDNCENGKFFHLSCLGLNRMPNNYQTTWKCSECNKVATVHLATTPTKYCFSSDSSSGEGVWLLLTLCQCSSKQMEVTVGFLQLHFPPAWSLEKIPHS